MGLLFCAKYFEKSQDLSEVGQGQKALLFLRQSQGVYLSGGDWALGCTPIQFDIFLMFPYIQKSYVLSGLVIPEVTSK